MKRHEPLAYTVNHACAVADCGRTKLYQAINNGSLKIKKLGNRTLILADDLKVWLNSLPEGVDASDAA
ncbi:MAG TPA: helix-turn-helix domain-containing protein [Hyphomonas sp.]|nr:helix-turn-helix domain-containing protein [Hyphomonas sp.]HRX72719.1 helix-turn-helix domain-containing protein [Hyphomonas sp.]